MKRIIVDIISCLFIILFLYTGIFKLLDLTHFKWALSKSPLLKDSYLVVANIIPPLEIGIAFLLLVPFFKEKPAYRKWGLRAGTTLMAMFTIYVWYMITFKSVGLPCTCGGIISLMNWHEHLYFNTAFTILGILAIILHKRSQLGPMNKVSVA